MAASHICTFAGPYAHRGAGMLPFTSTFAEAASRHEIDAYFRSYPDFLRALPWEVEGPTFSKLVLPRSRLGGGAQ